MAHAFDRPPAGFVRTKNGGLIAAQTPQSRTVARLKRKNEELENRLAALEERLEKLTK